jgi:hypothetical protein
MSDDIVHKCTCGRVCPICKGLKREELSVFNKTFWDLFLQKMLRNLASMKFQWLLLLYGPVVWGMFNLIPGTKIPWISATEGLSFLGGGFITLALGRIYAKTKLKENGDNGSVELDTDR